MAISLRASHVFICVDAFVDGKRAGGCNGTFMRVDTQATCKEVLAEFLVLHASGYSPLPDSTSVSMFCLKISDTVQGKPASDVGATQDCSIFLDYPISLAISEVPTKRFTFRCR